MKLLKNKFLLANLFIISITFISFYPSLSNGWTSWDDNQYVSDNPVVKNISVLNIKEVFTKHYIGSYLPLTMISYMIDFQIGEFDPMVYHRTNLLFHLINSCLAFWLVYLLSGNIIAALVVGVLFGIHPMRVESVAWISGRKDVLSMFFFLLSSISYLYFVKLKYEKWLLISFCLFVCAILSKIIVLTFPMILLLFDYHLHRPYSKSIVIEKIPFFLVSVAFSIIGYVAQLHGHAIKQDTNVIDGFVVSFHGIVFYLEKYILPVNLSGFYPYPAELPLGFYLYAAIFIVIYIFVLAWSKNALLKFSFLFFVISLLPVLQFIRFSHIFAADRFTYFAYIGLFYPTAILFASGWEKANKKILTGLALFVVVGLSIVTWERCLVWKDTQTFWNDVLQNYPHALESY